MFRGKLFLLLISLIFSASCLASQLSDWTILVYMDSSDDLSDMAIKNITDMALGKQNSNSTMLVQLHAFSSVALRYKIEKETISSLGYVPLTNISKDDLVASVTWAFSNYPAKHTMLILWNHGWGILDPQWNAQQKIWQIDQNTKNNGHCDQCSSDAKNLYKGFVFNTFSKSYLTNQDLVEVLKTLQATVLKGHKLDILGFDTCMGALFEISYHCAPYVRYHIGCQNCELKDGWDYNAFGSLLSHYISPISLCSSVVCAFDAYYKKRTSESAYTLAAFDLAYTDDITKILNTIIELVCQSDTDTKKVLKYIIRQARQESPVFCFIPMYTDMYAFCSLLYTKLLSLESTETIKQLEDSICILMRLLEQAVIANAVGTKLVHKAHGFSFYFPLAHIDSSYYKTCFAQESQWLKLLNFIIN